MSTEPLLYGRCESGFCREYSGQRERPQVAEVHFYHLLMLNIYIYTLYTYTLYTYIHHIEVSYHGSLRL